MSDEDATPAVTGTTGRVAWGVLLVLVLASMAALLVEVARTAQRGSASPGPAWTVLTVVCVLGTLAAAWLVLTNGAGRGADRPERRRALARAAGAAVILVGALAASVAVTVLIEVVTGAPTARTTSTVGVVVGVPLLGAVALGRRTRSAVSPPERR